MKLEEVLKDCANLLAAFIIEENREKYAIAAATITFALRRVYGIPESEGDAFQERLGEMAFAIFDEVTSDDGGIRH